MAEDPRPTVKVSFHSATLLARSTAALGTLNAAVADFLRGDPFRTGAGGGGAVAELSRVRQVGAGALRTVGEVSATAGELDLDRVAAAADDVAGGALSLAFHCLQVVRHTGLRRLAESEVDTLEEILEETAARFHQRS
jgi:uncharacterized protein with GYD domain